MTVYDIIKEYLLTKGFDGLVGDDCGCSLDDLVPCEFACGYCAPAYLCVEHKCPQYLGVSNEDAIYCQTKPSECSYLQKAPPASK